LAQETLIAVYPRIESAEAARLELESGGISERDIAVHSRDTMSVVGEASPVNQREPGFFEWLFGSDVPDEDRAGFERHVSDREGAILSVRADTSRYDEIASILDRHGPISLEEDDEQRVGGSAAATVETAAPAADTEQVIPTAKEELEIGKQRIENTRTYRVRRYVIERPVEEEVMLHDETVVVEHRQPAQAAPGERPFEEKIVEVTESREEPVVRKVTRPGEEVVIRKEGQDRVETVRDTVRESKVEVDKAAAGDKPPAGSGKDSRS
jgi:stress response protein YsnF